ncbi:hypothetical protein [Caenibacillus caldisaponilyticus]|uniref:hypothetical protein n=1 Tax=Caenibacillus caldisaponilyticus TaxID=1674942 RepID=UPI0009888C5E|nr:hypothetical protein [Caenibacillus caldisaponilyticus]
MGYIDADYYQNTYRGADAGSELDKYIERASDLIDQVTGFKISDFNALAPVVQEYVKKATAAQVEYYVVMGGDADVNAGAQTIGNVSIGSFSYGGSQANDNKNADRISPNALAYLEPTGLLYRGLDVVQRAHYSSNS